MATRPKMAIKMRPTNRCTKEKKKGKITKEKRKKRREKTKDGDQNEAEH
jgi:hypothetical protein